MMMKTSTILLVEENPYNEALTLHAFQKNRIGHKVFVVHDEAKALDYLFCTNIHSDRDPHAIPQPMGLDLKLPKVGITVRHSSTSEALRDLQPIRYNALGFRNSPRDEICLQYYLLMISQQTAT